MTRQEFIDAILIASSPTGSLNNQKDADYQYRRAVLLAEERAKRCPFDDDAVKVTAPKKLHDEYWKGAPEWANWAAMDEDGEWYLFEETPIIRFTTWAMTFGNSCLFTAPPAPDWKKSLTGRPKPTKR